MIVCTKCAEKGKIVDGAPGMSLEIKHQHNGMEFAIKPEIRCIDNKMHLCNLCLLEAFTACTIDDKMKQTLEMEQAKEKDDG